ncbi:MAG: hypothetical protein JXR61_11020 [Prolixibacteraceae bacterium]|nr:hypothetical protein [Prolixibacteraceae bacterium]
MESILTKSIIASVLTLIIIVSGILLRKNGKPYKSFIFTLHKLAVVATTVFVVLIYVQHFKIFSFEGVGLIFFIISSLIFMISFITGTLLNFEKMYSLKIQITHRILSWLAVFFIPVIWLVCH